MWSGRMIVIGLALLFAWVLVIQVCDDLDDARAECDAHWRDHQIRRRAETPEPEAD